MNHRFGDKARAKPPVSGDLRSRFPKGAEPAPPAEIAALRQRAYRQGLCVVDTRSDSLRAQPWAVSFLDWYSRQMRA